MIWDARRRVYVRDDGSIVSPAELRQLIENYIEQEKAEVDSHAQELITGTITAAIFFDWLREKIKEVHGAAGLVAYGGEDQMNSQRWARIGQKVASETAYANAFERDFLLAEKAAQEIISEASTVLKTSEAAIETIVRTTPGSEIPAVLVREFDAAETIAAEIANAERIGKLIFGQTPSRAQMYMESVYATHENSVGDREADSGIVSGRRICEEDEASCDECVAAASEDYIPLAEITDIGSLTCLSNCRCTIEFDYAGIGPLTIDRSIYAPGFANIGV